MAEHDKDLLEGLKKRGFCLDYGPDGAGFLPKAFEKGGGYYVSPCSQ